MNIVADVLIGYARGMFDVAAVLMVREGFAFGWRGDGPDLDIDRVETIIEQFPSVSEDDVRAVIAFAAQAAADDLPAPSPRVAGAGR